MERATVLQRWFDMAKDDETVIDRDDINHEAHSNLWHFSPTEAEQVDITAKGLRELINAVLDARRAQLGGSAMRFYCWHDSQARQLRLSLVSQAHGRLPFAREIRETSDPADVATRVHADWFDLLDHEAIPESGYSIPTVFSASIA